MAKKKETKSRKKGSPEAKKETLGRFEVVRELGRGGMGIVLLGLDPMIDRHVALKVIKLDETSSDTNKDLISRFFIEAKAAGKLNHPNIVTIYDLGEEAGQSFIAMEYIEGNDLSILIKNEGALPLGRASVIASQVANALAFAHEKGIVHRDIKPANILLHGGDRVKITDFGLARLQASASITHTGAMIGSPAYMSPEQIKGNELDGRSDVFSLGVMFYEMVTGSRPFTGSSFSAIIMSILESELTPPSEVNSALDSQVDNIVKKMLAKDRDDRYQTCREVEEALLPFRGDTTDVGMITISAPADEMGGMTVMTDSGAVMAGEGEKKTNWAFMLFLFFIIVVGAGWLAYKNIPEVEQTIAPVVAGIEPVLSEVDKDLVDFLESVDRKNDHEITAEGADPKPDLDSQRQDATPPTLVISSKPSGAKVVIKGEVKGETPVTITDLLPGEWKIELALKGYGDEVYTVSLAEDKETALAVTLKETTAFLGFPGPMGARVYLNGKKIGKAPLTKSVTPGRYKVKVSLKGYVPYYGAVTVKAGKTVTPVFTLEKKPTKEVDPFDDDEDLF